jgi:TPR repeat protein
MVVIRPRNSLIYIANNKTEYNLLPFSQAHGFGEGVDRDYAWAYRLYCLAALQGDGEAAYHLGWMHLNGHGMAANDALAVGWFQLAAERGDSYSRHLLDDVLTNVTPWNDSGRTCCLPLSRWSPASTRAHAHRRTPAV